MPWDNEQVKRHRTKRIEEGLCKVCGHERGDRGTTTLCEFCKIKQNERAESKRRLNGMLPMKILEISWIKGVNCKDCRETLSEGRTTHRCEECSTIANEAAVIKKKERHMQNMCQNCGKHKPITHGQYHLCYGCYLRAAASRHLGSTSRWRELRDLWDKQKGICPYTRKQLTLGIDASVDHKHPQSRYPELKNDINNIEWIDFKINLMKRDLTKEEFLQLIGHIVDNTKK